EAAPAEAPEPIGADEPDSVPEPIPEPLPDPLEVAPDAGDAGQDVSGVPEPVPHTLDDDEEPVPQAGEWGEQGLPGRCFDGGGPTAAYEPVDASASVDELPRVEVDEPSADDGSIEPATEVAAESAIEEEVSLSSIPIDDDDLVAI